MRQVVQLLQLKTTQELLFKKKFKQKALKIWYVVWQIKLFNEQFYEGTKPRWWWILSSLLEKKEQNKNEKDVISVHVKGDPFRIEVELDMKMSHTRFIDLIRSEFSFLDSQALVVTKLPDILIRNDRDVKRLKNGDQVEFCFVNDQST